MQSTWELPCNHYVHIKEMDGPWMTAYLNYILYYYGGFRPGAEALPGTSGAFDSHGWCSWLCYRDINATIKVASSVSSTAFPGHASQTLYFITMKYSEPRDVSLSNKNAMHCLSQDDPRMRSCKVETGCRRMNMRSRY